MSKRIRISFETINNGNYEVIPPEIIAETNKRIKAKMKPIIREFNRKQAISIINSTKIKNWV